LVATLPILELGNVAIKLGNLAMSFCRLSALSVVWMSLVCDIAKCSEKGAQRQQLPAEAFETWQPGNVV
jgi:hypothetical protein